MDYARIVDIHEWYRTWGIDWPRLDDNFDVVGIRAGVGVNQDDLLEFFVDKCVGLGKPYFTYHIPMPTVFGYSIQRQAESYLSWPGVIGAVQCADFEPPYSNDGRMVNGREAVQYINMLPNPIWYGNANSVGKMSWPHDLANYYNWIASYYYEPYAYTDFFKTFEAFLQWYTPEALPSWLRGSIYADKCLAWQFTHKGDAFHYLSVPPNGIRSADLSLSCIDKDACIGFFSNGVVEPPPPEQEDFMVKTKCVRDWQYVRSDHVVSSSTHLYNSNGTAKKIYRNDEHVSYDAWFGPAQSWLKISMHDGTVGWVAAFYGGVTYQESA